LSQPKIELTEEVLREIERQVTENVLKALKLKDGIFENFQSTGIQDSSTACQVTILDNATVVENRLIASAATITGDLLVEGDLKLLGEIPTNSPFYRDLVEHSAGILKLSMADGIDLGPIKIGSAAEQPIHDAHPGSIMFNSAADYGKPAGWISLGKTKWAPFSIIN
jgi:hypothetical protein